MFKLSLINPLVSYDPIKNLDLETLVKGGISEIKFTGDINAAYQLDVTIDPTLYDAYNYLLNGRDNGLRIDTENFSLAFVQSRGDQEKVSNNTASFRFYSSVFDLTTDEPLVQPTQSDNPVYSGSAQSFINSISSDYSFMFMSGDKNVNYQIPNLNNFDLLKDFLVTTGWEFREDGLIEVGGVTKPQILIGDIRQIPNLYENTGLGKYKTYFASNRVPLDNPNRPEALIINSVKDFARGDVYTHCYAIVQGGMGSSGNARIEFTNPTASYINSEYPLELINGKYYVRNSKVSRAKNRYYLLPINTATNIQDPNVTDDIQFLPQEITEEDAYNQVVDFLRSKTDENYLSYDFTFKEFILPGNKVDIDFRQYAEVQGKGKQLTFNVRDSLVLRDVSYDNLTQFIER